MKDKRNGFPRIPLFASLLYMLRYITRYTLLEDAHARSTYRFKANGTMNNGTARLSGRIHNFARVAQHICFFHALLDGIMQLATRSSEFVLILNQNEGGFTRIQTFQRIIIAVTHFSSHGGKASTTITVAILASRDKCRGRSEGKSKQGTDPKHHHHGRHNFVRQKTRRKIRDKEREKDTMWIQNFKQRWSFTAALRPCSQVISTTGRRHFLPLSPSVL